MLRILRKWSIYTVNPGSGVNGVVLTRDPIHHDRYLINSSLLDCRTSFPNNCGQCEQAALV